MFSKSCGAAMALRPSASASASSSSSSPASSSSSALLCQSRSSRGSMACFLPSSIAHHEHKKKAPGTLLPCFSAQAQQRQGSFLGGLLRPASIASAGRLCRHSRARVRVRVRVRAALSSTTEGVAAAAAAAPSVTWGVIPGRSEERQRVMEYLRSQGIVNTAELRGVELPASIEVMEERVAFLKRLGLGAEAINGYPLMVSCSIKKNLVPVLDYLESLGFRARDLPAFLARYPMVLHSSVAIDLMPTVDYLLGLDIQRNDIRRVLSRYPEVLGFRLEGTMSTSVAYLIGIGVRARCIGRMLTEFPEILGMRVASTIKPKVDLVASYGVPKSIVARMLEARPDVLGFDLDEASRPAIECLERAGVSKAGIAGIITHYPDILGQRDVQAQLSRKTAWLLGEVRVAARDVPRIVEKLPQILLIKEGLAMERVRYLVAAGCSRDDVAAMVSECPQLLALSIAQAIDPSLKFLTGEMKRSVEEVVNFPSYFTYDLKSRIAPRHRMVAQRGIECSLEWFLNCSDRKFKERLEADYIDREDEGEGRPDEHGFRMGGPVCIDGSDDERAKAETEMSISGLESDDDDDDDDDDDFDTASDFDDEEEIDYWNEEDEQR